MKVSSTSNVKVTNKSLLMIWSANELYRLGYTFKQIGELMNLSERTARRYYYGIHSLNTFQNSREQIRVGACVPIW
jgi:hypothetical protein